MVLVHIYLDDKLFSWKICAISCFLQHSNKIVFIKLKQTWFCSYMTTVIIDKTHPKSHYEIKSNKTSCLTAANVFQHVFKFKGGAKRVDV